jgi:hypothetical protein
MPAVMSMRRYRSFVRATALSLLFTIALPVGAFAQSPSPAASPAGPEPGLCAPWHKCMAMGAGLLTVLLLLALAAGYLVQQRGFDTIEHRMGQPQGVPAKKE